ncbi:MAG: PAS domain S-box protein [Desulfovibrio sp.]|jgi:two-component system sensor histidine kinase HydH|nr:PAS domain S-box protein [Desulfovibrio sp.]
MGEKPFKLSGIASRLFFGLSPWLFIGVPIILGLVIAALAVRNSERERQHITRNILDRADALIWALEAGARTSMDREGRRTLLQPLIEETSRQPGVVYLAVIDSGGRILAHSDPDKVGTAVGPGTLPPLPPEEITRGRLSESPDKSLLIVCRGFFPLQGGPHPHHGHHGQGMMRWRGQTESPVSLSQAKATSYAFLGLDRKPFADALAVDRRNNLQAASIVAAFGLAGLVSLFWAHSYNRSRRKLKDSQALAGEVVTSLPLGLITSDPDGKINMINASALSMLGVKKEAVSGTVVRDIPGLDWDAVTSAAAGRERVYEREMELAPPDAKKTLVSVSASEIRDEDGLFLGHLFILRDVAEVKRLQAEVQRNERLIALGNLAAGVAHEIRNPLSSIKGLATFLANRTRSAGPEEEAAKTMVLEVNRLDRVVSELLEFARPGTVKLGIADINDVITRALRLADTDIHSKGIRVNFVPDTSLPLIPLNAERMTQALLNLILNAVQAMEQGGELHVSAENRSDDECAIVVSDTGKGMDRNTLSSIFTPYFTTKPSGTGLGLAIVHQIIEGHGGAIAVSSIPGAGSVFSILLPLRESMGDE